MLYQPSYGGSRRELGKLQFPPGESPCVSHMAIYAGSSLADTAAPPGPLPRYPSITCRAVEVVRSAAGDRTLGVALTLEPNLGEVARSSFPSRGQSPEFLKVRTGHCDLQLETKAKRSWRRPITATMAFSWLKVPTSAFTFKTLC